MLALLQPLLPNPCDKHYTASRLMLDEAYGDDITVERYRGQGRKPVIAES